MPRRAVLTAFGLVIGVLCAPRPCLAQAARGPHFTGQLALAEGIGERGYQGPTLGVGDAKYSDHFNALTPELTLGAVYQLAEHWALGLDGVAGIAPSINPDASIPGVPLGVRVVHLWRGPATTTLITPTLGVSLFL